MPCGHCGIGGHNRKTCPLLRAGVQEVPPVPTHRPAVAGQSTSTRPSTTLIPPAPTHGLIPVIPPPPSHTLNPFKKKLLLLKNYNVLFVSEILVISQKLN